MPAGTVKLIPPKVRPLPLVFERSCAAVAELFPPATSVASPKRVNEAARTAELFCRTESAVKRPTMSATRTAFIAHLLALEGTHHGGSTRPTERSVSPTTCCWQLGQ